MKKQSSSIIIFLLFVLCAGRSMAQSRPVTMYAKDINGTPIRTSSYTDVKGSPYLTNQWVKGVVKLDNNQTYNLEIKYDMIADNLMFRTSENDSLNFVQPVKEFKLDYIADGKSQSHLFRSGFPATDAKTDNASFYEVLYDGGTKLLKRQAKTMWKETTSYGTPNNTMNITERITYFIFQSDKMLPLKTDRKSVISALSNKSAEVEKYIKDNKLDTKNETDLVKVFTYYNSLN